MPGLARVHPGRPGLSGFLHLPVFLLTRTGPATGSKGSRVDPPGRSGFTNYALNCELIICSFHYFRERKSENFTCAQAPVDMEGVTCRFHHPVPVAAEVSKPFNSTCSGAYMREAILREIVIWNPYCTVKAAISVFR